ncbi:FAD-dependent oxidoreductase [Microbacterium xylanilyticum]
MSLVDGGGKAGALMDSLWIDGRTFPTLDPWDSGAHADSVVVGGGLTGLVTALLLARAGMSVTVLEAHHVGALTTGRSTAKLSLLQGECSPASDGTSRHAWSRRT